MDSDSIFDAALEVHIFHNKAHKKLNIVKQQKSPEARKTITKHLEAG